MFTDEEVEAIREDADVGTTYVRERTSPKRFTSSIVVSLVLAVLMVAFTLSVGTVGALVAGAGGIQGDIDMLVGQDVAIYPSAGESATCPSSVVPTQFDGRPDPGGGDHALPVLNAEVEQATIPAGESLFLHKGIRLPDAIVGIDNISILLSQEEPYGETIVDDTTFTVTQLRAEEVDFGQTIINEQYTEVGTSDPERAVFGPGPGTWSDFVVEEMGEFYLSGEGATLVGANGVIHYLSFSQLSIDNLRIEVEYNRGDAAVPVGDCPAPPT